MVFQPYQGESVLGRRQGSLQVGERLRETTLIIDTFTSLVLPEAGTDSCPFTWEGVRNPHTAEDPTGPCSEQVYITTLAFGLLSTFQAQHPYQLPLLGMGTSTEHAAQTGQSFPLLLKDGNTTLQPTRTLGKITLGHQKNTAAQGGRLPKMHKSTTISAQTLLLPSSQPRSWPPARGSCRDINPWPSTSSTPGDAGCEEQSVTGPSTTSLPSTTSSSPTGAGTLPALPENTSQKASRFTRAPREGRHPPRQVSGCPHSSRCYTEPLPQGAPGTTP